MKLWSRAIAISSGSTVTVLWLGHLNAIFARGWLASWPWWAQFGVLLVSIDFVKWSVHNLLHRVPWLWEFHKVHHSIVELDWIGDWRFHWGEMLVYNGLLYAPTALLGASAGVALAVGVFDTLIGHFAHANLRWRIGWLKYVVNSPQMHINALQIRQGSLYPALYRLENRGWLKSEWKTTDGGREAKSRFAMVDVVMVHAP